MDLTFDDAADEFRSEVRAWLADHVPAQPLPSMDTAEGFEAHREWERTMAADRMSVVSWPEEFGGRDAPLLHWVIFEEEYYRAGAPGRVSQNGIFLLAPTLFEHAHPEQLARIMPRMARADDIWGQAWSEPEAGSDLASLRSTATRTDAEIDDAWVDGYLFSLSGPIYAGTNEIQRNVIAERLLGLPRGDR